MSYIPMKCSAFAKVLSGQEFVFGDPLAERQMKLHGLTCQGCRKNLETAAEKSELLTQALQEIEDTAVRNADVIKRLIEESRQNMREILAESFRFFDADGDSDLAEPNVDPLPSLIEHPHIDRSNINRDVHDARHAHFNKMLNVDGDD